MTGTLIARGTVLDLCYLFAAVTFILALKGLSNPKRARSGNFIAMFGMAVAIVATFFQPNLHNIAPMVIAMVVGAAIGIPVSRFVKMTAMPQLVAIFNGVGGGAAALVSVVGYMHLTSGGEKPATYVVLEVLLGVLIGTVSFSGSAIAYIKLQELITGRPITYPGQQVINALLGVGALALIVIILIHPSIGLLWILLAVAFIVGMAIVLPIGGADVPVLISLLNSLTGIAVAASGFTLNNNMLIVAGTLVGASGLLLTQMMCKAMGRSLPNILFSAFGSAVTAGAAGGGEDRPVRSQSPEDIGVTLAYAKKVAIIPGYGLAVAQAQHTIRELADELEAKGIDVFYAIHPVAGRMPGHMNVLLAEATVPYDKLLEMDEANPLLKDCDVALVVGANDTVNPAAREAGSPISGMPIINADEAGQVVFLKRSMRPGFAGIENELLFNEKTTLVFGDAKETLTKMVASVAAN